MGDRERRCEAVTNRPSPYNFYGKASHQCSRVATYTNGQRYLCAQHVKEPATVLRKSSKTPQAGYKRIDHDNG